MSVAGSVRAVTTLRLTEMKQRGEKIAMLTSYDYSTAKIVDAAGIDVILVGDSAANVMAGFETTVPITLDDMIYHARSVVRAVNRALVVVDLPFGTYQHYIPSKVFRPVAALDRLLKFFLQSPLPLPDYPPHLLWHLFAVLPHSHYGLLHSAS